MNAGSILWIASYPKSGNTWMRAFLSTLERGSELERLDDIRMDLAVISQRREIDMHLGLTTGDLSEMEVLALHSKYVEMVARSRTTRAFCKVHDAYVRTPSGDWLFPPSFSAGALYIVRDPRDVAVSYAHHSAKSIDQIVMRMAEGRWDHGLGAWTEIVPYQRRNWSEHVESWIDAPDLRRLVVRYEDMLAEPLATFTRVADFVGLPKDTQSVTAAIEATRFERLREREAREGFKEKMNGDFFFRQGRAGGWREVLTAMQVSRIVADHGRVMRRLGYLE